jgi:hypothetical protein
VKRYEFLDDAGMREVTLPMAWRSSSAVLSPRYHLGSSSARVTDTQLIWSMRSARMAALMALVTATPAALSVAGMRSPNSISAATASSNACRSRPASCLSSVSAVIAFSTRRMVALSLSSRTLSRSASARSRSAFRRDRSVRSVVMETAAAPTTTPIKPIHADSIGRTLSEGVSL